MGACASRPEGCVGGRFGGSRNKKIRKRRKKQHHQKSHSQLSDRSSFSDNNNNNKFPSDRNFHNPTFHGSGEEAWFDSAAHLESDWSDEDYQSVPDDIHSINSIVSPRDSISGAAARSSSVAPTDSDHFKGKSDEQGTNKPVFVDEISTSADDNGGDGLLDNCGIIPNNCLPFLTSTVPPIEKRRSVSSPPPSMRKKAALKLSFKWKEGHSASTLFSSKALLQRPMAGSQVPFCPLGKRVPETWSDIEPGTFRVRGVNYFRDKKKDLAPNCAAYNPFGLDVFLSPRKINHIARFVDLPFIKPSGKLPPILVVNVQIPLYPAAIFQGETDGEGINFALYFKLSENFATDLSPQFQENIRKLIDDEVEKVRGFPVDTVLPFRERLKILGRVGNVDDLPLSAAERKLMNAYNEKPVLSRPQHEFYMGENYMEIDLDMHRFSYISRKGFATFFDRLKLCILDFGLTIQGNKAEELPEQILCCIRLNEIDYSNYHQLGISDENLE